MTQGHLSQGRMRESGTHFSVNLSTCNSAKPEARKHPNCQQAHCRNLFSLSIVWPFLLPTFLFAASAEHCHKSPVHKALSPASTFLHPDTERCFGSVCSDTGQLTVTHFRCRTKRTLEQIPLQSNCQQTGGPLVFLCLKTQPWVSACATCQTHSSMIKELLSHILLPALTFQENGMQNSYVQRCFLLLILNSDWGTEFGILYLGYI